VKAQTPDYSPDFQSTGYPPQQQQTIYRVAPSANTVANSNGFGHGAWPGNQNVFPGTALPPDTAKLRNPVGLLPPVDITDFGHSTPILPVQATQTLNHGSLPLPAEALNATISPETVLQESEPPRTFVLPPESAPYPDGSAPFQPPAPFVRLMNSRIVGTWIPAADDEIGLFDYDLRGAVIFPRRPGLAITSGFQHIFLDGPKRTDLPPNLYSAYIEIAWKQPLTPRWSYELAVAPGIYSDFDNTSSDAFRITGRGLVFYGHSKATQLVFGVLYLDREDVTVLPAFGIIHAPNEDVRFELLFPKPRISKRINNGPLFEQWVYVAGEFGGGSWAIDRATGAKDIVTYSDWRLILGFEQRHENGHAFLLEAAYVFNRELEYRSERGDFEPNSTMMFRAGVMF